MLIDVRSYTEQRVVGTTLDDAAGEAFDKGARLLGLGYPGGREIDRLAQEGDPAAYDFPVARVAGLDFSFSGLKTALLYAVRGLAPEELERRRADLAASYQRAIVRALVERVREARAERVAVVGGVAANSELREALAGGAVHGARPVPGVSCARCVRLALSRGMHSCSRSWPRRRPSSSSRPAARAHRRRRSRPRARRTGAGSSGRGRASRSASA
jgi:hypothetical protein